MQRRAADLMHIVETRSREKGTLWKVSGKSLHTSLFFLIL